MLKNSKKIQKTFRNCSLVGAPFSPRITDGMWFISHWNVIHTNIGKNAVYIFGTDGIHATLYNKNNPDFKLEDLAINTPKEHIEERDDFKSGLFRFEFNGEKFELCEKEPKWAHYDCGRIED